MQVRAKFKVSKIEQTIGSKPTGEKDDKGYGIYVPCQIDTVVMSPVMGEDNKRFWTASPSGELRLGMTNPDVAGLFKLGQSYYLDFSDAPDAEPK